MARESDYVTEARAAARKLWDLLFELEQLQQEWHSLDYGNTLDDGEGENAGISRAEVGAVIIDTCNELRTRITQTGHSANVAKLL